MESKTPCRRRMIDQRSGTSSNPNRDSTRGKLSDGDRYHVTHRNTQNPPAPARTTGSGSSKIRDTPSNLQGFLRMMPPARQPVVVSHFLEHGLQEI
jgi:hypothetical protein